MGWSSAEIVTVAVSCCAVVGATVAGTLYATGQLGSNTVSEPDWVKGKVAYELGDAFFTCRDHVPEVIPHKVRNLVVDTHSSRFNEKTKSNIVFMDADIIERPGSFNSRSNYRAKITCDVSVVNNEIKAFNVRRI